MNAIDRDMDELEAIVDRIGFTAVLDALSDIAYLKSSHCREAWQDESMARGWAKAGNRVYKAQMEVEALALVF